MRIFLLLTLTLLQLYANVHEASAHPTTGKPYFGFSYPGTTPVILDFSQYINSHFKIANPVFANKGKEFYFTDAASKQIYSMLLENGQWTKAKKASFSNLGHNYEPFISRDGMRVYFISDRQYPKQKRLRAFVAKRDSLMSDWHMPHMLFDHQSTQNFYFPNEDQSGNVYFGVDGKGTLNGDDMYHRIGSTLNLLPAPLNSKSMEWDPYISPDGSYLIWCSSRATEESENTDLYIAFKTDSGHWGEAQKLSADINTSEYETAATTTEDGRFIIFTRNYKSGMKHYWVSSEILNSLSHN